MKTGTHTQVPVPMTREPSRDLFNPRAKKPPRCISAGGGSVLIAQGAMPVCLN